MYCNNWFCVQYTQYTGTVVTGLCTVHSVHVYSGPEVGVRGRADIHPELTMDKIQNPPDARRSVLTSFGSRYINKSKMATFIQSNWLSCIAKILT